MTTETAAPGLGAMKLYNALLGVTALAVFVQGLSAGVFMALRGQSAADGWEGAHHVIGWIAVAAALATAIVAVIGVRATSAMVAWGTVALVVLMLVETLIGQFIHPAGGLVGVHVPLAMALMALVVWLSLRGAQVRRQLSAKAA